VICLDNFFTGSKDNIAHLLDKARGSRTCCLARKRCNRSCCLAGRALQLAPQQLAGSWVIDLCAPNMLPLNLIVLSLRPTTCAGEL